jgi:hypothetical protein
MHSPAAHLSVGHGGEQRLTQRELLELLQVEFGNRLTLVQQGKDEAQVVLDRLQLLD